MVEQASLASRLLPNWLLPAKYRNVQNQEKPDSNTKVDAPVSTNLSEEAKGLNASEAGNIHPSVSPESIGDRILGYVLNGLNALFSSGVPADAIVQEANKAISIASDELKAKSERLEQKAEILTNKAQELKDQASDYIRQRDEIIQKLQVEGYSKEQIDEIVSFADKKIALNVEGYKALMRKAEHLNNRAEGLKEVRKHLGGIKIVAKIAGNNIPGLDEVTDATMKTEMIIISNMTPDETEQSMPTIAQIDLDLHEIAGGRADLLAKIDAHNNMISKMIADKILPPENASEGDYARALRFVNDISRQHISSIMSELTQMILDKIAENNAKNEKADQVAYKKNMEKNKEEAVQDLKVAIRKFSEKIQILNYYANKLDHAVSVEEKNELLANILEQINKKTPLILS